VRFTHDDRPLPEPASVERQFFDSLAAARVMLPFCPRDGYFFYPRSCCPVCLQTGWSWREASGRGHIYSYTIDRVPHEPGLEALAPVVIALVDLEEGPRMVARIVDCPPDSVRVGLPLQAVFETLDGVTILNFRPSK
jgi:hypothetical protein